MSKIRMNTELRTKILNRYRESAEQENTQELEAYKQAREGVDRVYPEAFNLATTVVERSYPSEDVATCRTLKQKYGEPLDVVAKDKCFHFSYARENPNEDEDKTVTEHFDFGLYGDVDEGSSYNNESGKKFAYAYYRDELKAKDLDADILAKQNGKDDNPHKTKHIDLNDKALGYSGYSHYNARDNNVGLAKGFDKQYELDIIGTQHCRSRAIPCTKNEYNVFMMLHTLKSKVVSSHQTWIASVQAQLEKVKSGLKAYRYMTEAIEFCEELGVHVEEAEMIRANSTGLTIYEPKNLANLIKGMKNKTISREQKIAFRKQYEQNQAN